MRLRLAALFLLLLLTACAHRVAVKVIPIYTAEDEFGRARNLLDRKKYQDAATAFEQFTYNHQGSALLPDAIYYQGESRFLGRNYSEAIAPFERVVTEYPGSSYADRAQYRLGLCFFKESPSWELDQEMTDKAIEAFNVFLIKYPQSTLVPEVNRMIGVCKDKLAHKEYDAGRIYLTLKTWAASRIYFKNTIQNYPASFWARKAALGLAECDFLAKKYTEAKAGFEPLLKDPDAGIRKQAESRLREIARLQEKEPSQSNNK